MKPLIIVAVLVVASLGLRALGSRAQAAPPDPPKFADINSLLAADGTALAHDFSLVAKDAARGQNGAGEPACYNLEQNVDPDVAAIGYLVTRNIGHDRNDLQNDIGVIRHDIADFRSDLADFGNDGVPAPFGSAQTITEMAQKIRSAIATADRRIRQMNAMVTQAHTIGGRLATGPCAGRGPGSPPVIRYVS